MNFKNTINQIPQREKVDGVGLLYPEEYRGKVYYVQSQNELIKFKQDGTGYDGPFPLELISSVDYKSMIDDAVNEKLSNIISKIAKYETTIQGVVDLSNNINTRMLELQEKVDEVINDPAKMSKNDIIKLVQQSLKSNGPVIVEESIKNILDKLDKPRLNLMEMKMAEQMGITKEEYMQMIKDGFSLDFGFNK